MAAKPKKRKKFTRAAGAGRPPTGNAKKIIAFRMPAELMTRLAERATGLRMSRNMLSERILWDYVNRSDKDLQTLDVTVPLAETEVGGDQIDLFA